MKRVLIFMGLLCLLVPVGTFGIAGIAQATSPDAQDFKAIEEAKNKNWSEEFTITWQNDTKPGFFKIQFPVVWHFAGECCYELGLRSDGVVVWRKVEEGKVLE